MYSVPASISVIVQATKTITVPCSLPAPIPAAVTQASLRRRFMAAGTAITTTADAEMVPLGCCEAEQVRDGVSEGDLQFSPVMSLLCSPLSSLLSVMLRQSCSCLRRLRCHLQRLRRLCRLHHHLRGSGTTCPAGVTRTAVHLADLVPFLSTVHLAKSAWSKIPWLNAITAKPWVLTMSRTMKMNDCDL
jgi:hypothetical protein